MLSAEEIARVLGGRKSGNRWMVRCPAHEDRTPSCSLSADSTGKILVHCFTGCRQEDVIQALRSKGLWPEKPKPSWTAAEKRVWAHRHNRARRLGREARAWHRAICEDLESKKKGVSDAYRHGQATALEQLARYSSELYRLQSCTPVDALKLYLDARRENPGLTYYWVATGLRMERDDNSFGRLIVKLLQLKTEQESGAA